MTFLSQITPELIVAGGTTVSLLYFIYVSRLKDRDFYTYLSNHSKHELESQIDLTKALQKLTDKIDNLK